VDRGCSLAPARTPERSGEAVPALSRRGVVGEQSQAPAANASFAQHLASAPESLPHS
jgi:hypothetical protein